MNREESGIFTIFATSILVDRNFLSKETCGEIFEEIINYSNVTEHNAFTGNAVSSHLQEVSFLNRLKCSKIINARLQKKIDEYCGAMGFGDVKIVNSWFNIQNEDSNLKFHAHTRSIVSGAIYINVDENSSRITFLNPNYVMHYLELGEGKAFTRTRMTVTPTIGTLVLFPSWVVHGNGVTNNKTANRTVISFNAERSHT